VNLEINIKETILNLRQGQLESGRPEFDSYSVQNKNGVYNGQWRRYGYKTMVERVARQAG